MAEYGREDIDELVRSHAEGDITIRQIATIADLPQEVVYDLVESRYEDMDLGADGATPVTYTPDDVEKIRVAEQWRRDEISEDEARQQLDDDTVDDMIEDRKAFRDAMRRDTSDFLQSE